MQTCKRSSWNRRQFLGASLALAAASQLGASESPVGARSKMRAAIIGHTGRGNYGHEHELIFKGREETTQVVAVADPDEKGRVNAKERAGALRAYADYREMLEKDKPQLVVIAPRWTDQHHAMAMAALAAGAHVYLEKPITRTLAEADEFLDLARKNGLRIVVAHQMRLAPNILLLKEHLDRGMIGELLEVRAHGKQDSRAGGEDLIVLGVHLFDLMRFYAGDPAWCAARVLQQGHEITAQDVHPATEQIGPVAGDEIIAQFAFAKGVHGTFTSRAKNRGVVGPWGLELIGTKGSVRIFTEMVPKIYTLRGGEWTPEGSTRQWQPWEQDPTLKLPDSQRGFAAANARVLDDWLAAIAGNRDPVCSGHAAMKALEMAMAVFAAGLARTRVELPLKSRKHPLE